MRITYGMIAALLLGQLLILLALWHLFGLWAGVLTIGAFLMIDTVAAPIFRQIMTAQAEADNAEQRFEAQRKGVKRALENTARRFNQGGPKDPRGSYGD